MGDKKGSILYSILIWVMFVFFLALIGSFVVLAFIVATKISENLHMLLVVVTICVVICIYGVITVKLLYRVMSKAKIESINSELCKYIEENFAREK